MSSHTRLCTRLCDEQLANEFEGGDKVTSPGTPCRAEKRSDTLRNFPETLGAGRRAGLCRPLLVAAVDRRGVACLLRAGNVGDEGGGQGQGRDEREHQLCVEMIGAVAIGASL